MPSLAKPTILTHIRWRQAGVRHPLRVARYADARRAPERATAGRLSLDMNGSHD